jgi:transposase
MEIAGRTRPFTSGIELALDETAGEGRMAGRVTEHRVRLNRKPRKRLEILVRRRSPQHWMVQRAQIVLLSADGLEVHEIGARLSVDRQVVRRWVKRYLSEGFDGLRDRARSGRPPEIERHVWQKLATVVVQSPEKFGWSLARWSVRALHELLARRFGWDVSRSSISRFLRAMALKPHRVRYWLNPSDPDFDAKAAKICKLYVSPPAGTTVLCVDEKPGVQALKRSRPGRAMRAGKPARLEFEYERKGTRNVFAAFNVQNGHVLLWVTPDRTTPMVLSFLDQIAQFYRKGRLAIITDNISTRTGDAAAEWLRAHPRIRFVFTPKHGSWLNQVEIWFGILTRSALRHRSFAGVAELAVAIYRFGKYWNDVIRRPFDWTYTGRVLHA